MSIHLFIGDGYLRGRAIEQLKGKLRAKSALTWTEVHLDGEEFSPERFTEALQSSTLFSEGIILHLKSIEKLPDPDSVAGHLERPLPPEHCIILEGERLDKRSRLYKTVARVGEIHEHPRPDRRSLPQLVSRLLKEQRLSLPPQGVRYLLESVEGDLARIGQEIDKLALYARGRRLSMEDLKGLLFHDRGGDVFSFLEAFFERRAQAYELLRGLIERGEEPSKIFFLIASEARALLVVRSLAEEGRSRDEIAQITADYPWRVTKRLRAAQHLKASQLIGLIHLLHLEDLKIKRGERRPEEALWALLLDWLNGS